MDKENSIWVGTDGGGLSKFANGKFKGFEPSSQTFRNLMDCSVTYLYQSEANIIWICTEEGIYRYDTRNYDIQHSLNGGSSQGT